MSRFLLALLLAAFALAAPAAAQDKLKNTPAEKFLIAPGGVDMRTGRYAYSETDLSGGEGALSLTRILPEAVGHHANPFGNFSHNWDIFLVETPTLSKTDDTIRMNVHHGGRSLTFEAHGYSGGYAFRSDGQTASLTYTQDRLSGTAVHTMRGPDGTVMVFRPLASSDCADQAWASGRRRCAFVSEMTEPDGTRYTFDYAAAGGSTGNLVRLARVTSSRGYALLLEGSLAGANLVGKACLLNLALGPAPAPGSACPAGALAAAAYDYSGAKLAKVHPPGGGLPSTFDYPDAATTRFLRPGESQAWLTNRVGSFVDEEGAEQEVVATQVFADGRSYSYAWGVAPQSNDFTQPLQTAAAAGNVAGGSYTDADGNETVVGFDWKVMPGTGSNHCIGGGCSVEPDDAFQTYVYQQTPGPVEIVDPLGRTTRIDYCDPFVTNGCSVTRMQSSTDPEGIRTTYEYDGNGNIRKETTYPRPGVLNADGTPPQPIAVSAEYDLTNPRAQTKPRKIWDARGNLTEFTYSTDHGGVLTETGPAPTPNAPRPQKRYAYGLHSTGLSDSAGPLPSVWVLTRMAFCRMSGATGDPASPCQAADDEVVTSYDYGAGPGPVRLLGQVVTADGVALRTCYGYDSLGRRISETSPNAGLASCPASPPTEALPYTTSTRFDATGRVTGTIAPDPDPPSAPGQPSGPLPFPAVRSSYDPAGRAVKVEQGALASWQSEAVAPENWTGFTIFRTTETAWDAMSRKVREAVKGEDGIVAGVTEYSYDRGGRLECTAVRMNPDAWAVPLADKCIPGPAHAVNGPDRISKNLYDKAGQLEQVLEGVGTPLARAEATYGYNLNGQRTSLTDARGFRAEMTYDGHGRQSRWIFPSKTTPGAADAGDYESYVYNEAGNRTKLRKRDGSLLTYEYDALGRVTRKDVPTSATGAAGYSVFTGYDLRGLQTYARFGSATGTGITNAYDGFGRLVTTWTNMDGTSRKLSSEYDRDGHRITLWDNGVSYSGKYVYDGLGRMRRYLEGFGPVAFELFYDAAGRRSRLELGFAGTISSTMAYGYDPSGRLRTLTRQLAGAERDQRLDFTYNPASQIDGRTNSNDAYAWTDARSANRTYAVNGLNQYASAGDATFAWDANGNLKGVAGVPEGATSYIYDAENRLVSVSGARTATLSYDPLGRLWQISSPTGTTRFLYDGDDLIQEYDGTGRLLRDYDHAAGADEPLLSHEYHLGGGYDRSFLHADQQGSIVAVTETNGNATAINSYDEYGIPGAANAGRFQYTGQAYLPEIGLYYYKARIYSPTLGRFLQVDPIGYDDQINLYGYVGNDPINMADASGLAGSNEHLEDVLSGRVQPTISPQEGVAGAKVLGVLAAAGTVILVAGPAAARIVQGIVRASAAREITETASRTRIGEHAGESIPARSAERNFNAEERREINRIGSQTGCHNCGTTNPGTKRGNFVPDHQPPSALNARGSPQRLYPQCLPCSRQQGLELAKRAKEVK